MTEDVVIRTPRVRLRALSHADVDALGAILGDPDVMRYYPAPFDRARTTEWIEWNVASYDEHGFGLWAVILEADGSFAGDCGLTVQDVGGRREVEVGYHLDKRLWGQGLATEAAAACRDHAFDVVGVTKLVAIVDPRNTASRRVAERIGMRVDEEIERGGRRQLVYATTRAKHY